VGRGVLLDDGLVHLAGPQRSHGGDLEALDLVLLEGPPNGYVAGAAALDLPHEVLKC
jgi:hypothetical protein